LFGSQPDFGGNSVLNNIIHQCYHFFRYFSVLSAETKENRRLEAPSGRPGVPMPYYRLYLAFPGAIAQIFRIGYNTLVFRKRKS
jgi:hypothetical protein